MRPSTRFVTKKLLPLRAEREKRAQAAADDRYCRALEEIYNRDVVETEQACAALRRHTPESLAEKYRDYHC